MTSDLSLIAGFPQDFLFGAATSSYQIEGSALGGCGPSHWDAFARQPGATEGGADGSRACEHILHWAADLDLIANAGFNAYRFSFSWPRLLPEGGTGALGQEGVAFYDRLLDGMLERNLKPFATLYHWDLPLALAEAGGWQNRETALRFADYASEAARLFGSRLFSCATINEPWCVSWLSHYWGQHAPGLSSLAATAKALHHIMLAHGLGLEALRAEGAANLGIPPQQRIRRARRPEHRRSPPRLSV